jgi:hypothetical protein
MSGDAETVAALAKISDISLPHSISHYIYVATHEAAICVADDLRNRGFGAEERLSASGDDWLVLVNHAVVPSVDHMVALRDFMKALIEKHHGEYDGWQAEVVPRRSWLSRLRMAIMGAGSAAS